MPWSPVQFHRIIVEKRVLDNYFAGKVKWLNPRRDTTVELTMTTNNDKHYTLRVYLPDDFPNSVPDMVVSNSPAPMPDWEGNGETHTLKRRDGYLRICHYRSSHWTDENTLYQVFMKGRLWLEAYEGYLRTGSPMDDFLKHMPLKE